MNKVVLIGFMGSGKSSIAPLLAESLGYRSIEMDEQIIEASGFPNIPAIFSALGEPGFRELEARVARSLRDASSVVISTGGGVIGRASNIADLAHGGGKTVFLHTSFPVLRERIKDIHTRPLFKNQEQALALYEERLPLYSRYADVSVTTDGKTPAQVRDAILTQIRNVSSWENS
jgi:shikimate kinase